MKVSLVGIGMDGAKTLTKEAQDCIASADLLIGAKRMLAPFSHLKKATFVCWKAEEISAYLQSNPVERAVVLLSGDTGFYSGAAKLCDALANYQPDILCGIASPVYFCSKIQKPWQEMHFVSCHGTDSAIVRPVCRHRYCFFLLGGSITPKEICQRLCEYHLGNLPVWIGTDLAYDTEQLYAGIASEYTALETAPLAVMVVENPCAETHIPVGIPDDRWIRGKVPMTKREIRCNVISMLEVTQNAVCWDVGCGTGSVSVEMALQCFNGHVYAIDQKEDAVALTKENQVQFGCDHITTILGTAPESLLELPAPTHVFIGGSCGAMEQILEVVFSKNPNATVVISAIALETLQQGMTTLQKHGISPEIIQLAVTRTKTIGSHTMLSAENPIFLLKGVQA